MKTLIREKRKLIFQYKRINPADIRSLASIFEREAALEAEKNNSNASLIFSVDADDDSSYESQAAIIFNENEIINKKVIYKIGMRLNTIDYSKNIDLQLFHTSDDKNKENYILVSGDDSNWVNGIMAKFSDILKNIEDQPRINKKLGLLIVVLWLGINFYYFKIFWKYIVLVKNDLGTVLLYIGVPLLSMIIISVISSRIETLFPVIELQTGPDHMQIHKTRRKKLSLLFTALGLPIFTGFVYDLIKNFVRL